MVDLLSSKNSQIYKSALQYIGGILNSNNPYVPERCMMCGVLDKLTNLLYDVDIVVTKQACWAISNLVTNGNQYAEKFISSAAYFRCLILADTSLNIDVKEEAMWAINNAITSASIEGVYSAFMLEDEGSHGAVVRCLLKSLDFKTAKLISNSLEALTVL